MNSLDKQYKELLKTILTHGVVKEDRTGTGTKSIFGYTIRHNMAEGFPLLTTKKLHWKSIVTELLWFLRGGTSIKYLLDNDVHIWDGDAYQGYLKRFRGGLEPATKERFIEMIKNNEESRVNANGWFIGELGPIYGKQWRGWRKAIINPETGYEDFVYVDQIQNLINDLKTNPDSRRLMVSAWNVGELDQMVLPPCHYGFQVYTRSLTLAERIKTARSTYPKFNIMDFGHSDGISEEEFQHQMLNEKYPELPQRAISLMWNQRSVDTFLGLPFNIASYGLLLSILAKEVNMIPDQLIGNLGDTHLYLNHLDQAKEQMKRKGFNLPQLSINPNNEMRIGGGISTYVNTDFTLEGYESHPAIKAPLSN